MIVTMNEENPSRCLVEAVERAGKGRERHHRQEGEGDRPEPEAVVAPGPGGGEGERGMNDMMRPLVIVRNAHPR